MNEKQIAQIFTQYCNYYSGIVQTNIEEHRDEYCLGNTVEFFRVIFIHSPEFSLNTMIIEGHVTGPLMFH